MRIVRIDLPDGPVYGTLVNDEVELLAAAPWEQLSFTGQRVPLDQHRLLAPATPSKVVAVGRNYLGHVREMGYDVPTEPNLFLKPSTAVTGPDTSVVLPPTELSDDVEHEGELAVVIGIPTRNVAPDRALDHVFGYTCANDVSARDLQRQDASITRAKGFDTFCPLGPWVETGVDPGSGLWVRCRVNGELRQDSATTELIFGVADILAFASAVMTLLPGDVVLTGSPAGSGSMRPGDQVEIEIEGIGVLHHGVTGSNLLT